MYFSMKFIYKKISKTLRNLANMLGVASTNSIFECWRDFTLLNKDKAMYGIVVDVKDAFGNVDCGKIL